MIASISVQRVRYTKLGEGGEWATQCLNEGTLRIGFYTNNYFELCSRADWRGFGKRW